MSKIGKDCLDSDLTGLSSSLSLTILFFLDLLTLTGDIDSSSFSDLISGSSFVSTLILFSSFFGDFLVSSSILIFFGACACKVLSSEDRFPGFGAKNIQKLKRKSHLPKRVKSIKVILI